MSEEWEQAETHETVNEYIQKLFKGIDANQGKQIRSKLLFYMLDKRGRAQGSIPKTAMKNAAVAAKAIETLHSATLIHDDILDSTPIRRGEPSVHALHGSNVALIAGDVLFSKALSIMATLNDGYAISHTIKLLRIMCDGQMREIAWQQAGVAPSKDEILDVMKMKTGALMGLATRLGTYFATIDGIGGLDLELIEDLDSAAEVGEMYGIYYQLIDDIADMEEDSVAGIPTIPLLTSAKEAQKLAEKFLHLSTVEFLE